MALLIAPYNNAMRLGQGFNSYTHEICIDDAVIVSPQQAENVLTNDGNTMRLTALVQGKPSVWTKQDQVLIDVSQYAEAEAQCAAIEGEKKTEATSITIASDPEESAPPADAPSAPAENAPGPSSVASAEAEDSKPEAQASGTDVTKTADAGKSSDDAAAATAAAEKEAERKKAAALKIKQDEVAAAIHRRERDPAMLAAANKFKVSLSLDKMAEMHREFLLPKTKQAPGTTGSQTQVFDIETSTGVSQTVVFQSRFVNKISEITSDMGVSASLSIKSGSCGGSVRASFIDTDKFASSDLNYYISVKVINQSINFRDALEFNPLDNIGASEFNQTFGDAFVSGFLEGGELNALVSMKILNKAESKDIKAEGSIAIGKGSLDISAQGAFATAKANLDLNTETTVQVSWLGGGLIKPPEEAWTIESLARAATRFPDHVAQSPQRTYAILTKYETLRSYQVLKPPTVTPLDYKNATAYSNELMDLFCAYKAIYSRLTAQISDCEAGQLKFTIVKAEEDTARQELFNAALCGCIHDPVETLSDNQKKAKIGYFLSTPDGLDDARGAVRTQMNYIIERVDNITKDPSTVLSSPKEKFLPVYAFEELLPTLEPTFRNNKRTAPLSGEKMFSDGSEQTDTDAATVARLCLVRHLTDEAASQAKVNNPDGNVVLLNHAEKLAISKFLDARDEGVEATLRLTPPLGSEQVPHPPGTLFNALDFVQPEFLLQSIKITITEGVVSGIACRYANGISWKRGLNDPKTACKLDLKPDERITSVLVTVGTEAVLKSPEYVLSLKLVINSGLSLEAAEPNVRRGGFKRKFIGKRAFFDLRSITFESPLERGYMVGFWGWSAEQGSNPGPFRLGVVWANSVGVDLQALHAEKIIKAQQVELEKEIKITDVDVLKTKLGDAKKDLAASQAKMETLEKAAQDQAAKLAQLNSQINATELFKQQVQNQQWFNNIKPDSFGVQLYRDNGDGRVMENYRPQQRLFAYGQTSGDWKTVYNLDDDGKRWYIHGVVDNLTPPPREYRWGGINVAPGTITMEQAYGGVNLITDREQPGTTLTFVPLPDNYFRIGLLDGPEDCYLRPDSVDVDSQSGIGLYKIPDSGPFYDGARWRLVPDPIAAKKLKDAQDQQAKQIADAANKAAQLSRALFEFANIDVQGIKFDAIDNADLFALSVAIPFHRSLKDRGDVKMALALVYGGKIFTDQGLQNRVLEQVRNRGAFAVRNEFFGEDPQPYVAKNAAVIYWQDDRVKARWAKEGQTIYFNN
ncbi:unnamed protein product [Tilletia caries]|uniref:Uncharacterized protein n=1 Tax=Tilletia caries TaxID=13290 RepID=A0ABN7ITH3_9BASI|nr:unnamed protein product [Tilletia caries]CAD6916843.1 unnamed protein product [Tilletia caries]CAD6938722.1 unnamed protein product [Tilletia caries]CAD7060412.1 unnamed protein product [Tilletia caries]